MKPLNQFLYNKFILIIQSNWNSSGKAYFQLIWQVRPFFRSPVRVSSKRPMQTTPYIPWLSMRGPQSFPLPLGEGQSEGNFT